MARIGFWAVIVATAAVYLVMVLWSLPKVSALAGGLMPFDLRPTGYSAADAKAFLAVLGDDGRAFYKGIQHRLDLAYPALMAATLALCFTRLVGARWLRTILIAAAIGAMLADYSENFLVGQMLDYPADSAPEALIARASVATVVKSALGGIAMTALVIALVAAGVRRFRRG